MADPNKATHVTEYKVRRLPRIMKDTLLFDILHVFEEGGSHMALVVEEYDGEIAEIDTLRQSTASSFPDPNMRSNHLRVSSSRLGDLHTRLTSATNENTTPRFSLTKEQLLAYTRVSPILRPTDPHIRFSTATPPRPLNPSLSPPRLAAAGQDEFADFPVSQKQYKTLGIVTLEDVLEQLIGQEIVDETDVYVDVGRRIKVARAFGQLEKSAGVSTPNVAGEGVISAANSLHTNGINLNTMTGSQSPKSNLFGVGSIFNTQPPLHEEERQPLLAQQVSDLYLDALEESNHEIPTVVLDESSPLVRVKSKKQAFNVDRLGDNQAVVYGSRGAAEIAYISLDVSEDEG